MTKVCHMTSAHAPEDVRIFHKECVSLAKAGYDVTLVERGDSYEKDGVHIVGVGMPAGGRLERMTSFAKRIYEQALAVDAEIYHFHDPELLPYGLKLKRAGKKVIFDSHERYTEQLKNKPYLPAAVTIPMAKAYGCYERRVLKELDAVIFPCTMQGENPFAGLCRRVELISNAAILGEFFDQYDSMREKAPRQICYVGGLTKERGITNDVLASAKAEATLALAGEFSDADYEAEVRKLAEFSCVDYRGRLDRDDVRALLAESRIGLCTLLDVGQYCKIDTFGIKVFEYMSMALPVILSKSAYNCKMVDKYHFGLCIDPSNIDEIAEAITYLLDHPEEARQMGENGRRAVKEEFNWGVEEKKLLALYEDILKK